MAEKKIYLMIKVRVPFDKVAQFNEFWQKESLPIWLKYGAKHIGSFSNYVGDPVNEVVRLFEFESVEKWTVWEEFLANSESGQKLVERLGEYIVSLERKLLRSVY